VLKYATDAQNETFEKLKLIFVERDIRFTLVGAAACREYGLPRPTLDLDVVVAPYPIAIATLSKSGEFVLDDHDPAVTNRTCTQKHLKTGILVDFLTGGIRINNQIHFQGGIVHDAIPIPHPSGFGDVLPLVNLVALKISAAISGRRSLELGANRGVRPLDKIEQDIHDVAMLISVCKLGRILPLGDPSVERRYQEIYDGRTT
jgi:hypothetical protein